MMETPRSRQVRIWLSIFGLLAAGFLVIQLLLSVILLDASGKNLCSAWRQVGYEVDYSLSRGCRVKIDGRLIPAIVYPRRNS